MMRTAFLRLVGLGTVTLLLLASLSAQQPEPGSVVSWGRLLVAPGQGFWPPAKTPEWATSGVNAFAAGAAWSAASKADGSLVLWTSVWGADVGGPVDDPLFRQTIDDSGVAQLSLLVTNVGPVKTLVANHDPRHLDPDRIAALLSDGSVLEINNWDLPEIHPPPASLQSGVTAITYAGQELLASKQDGTFLVDGQPDPSAPVIPGGAKALASDFWGVAALALKPDGTVAAWVPGPGGGPVKIPSAAESGVIAIAAGEDQFLALKENGSVVAWGGRNDFGETNVPSAAQSGVKAIAAGSGFSLALKADGTVVHWGWDIGETGEVLAPLQGIVTVIAAGAWQALALAAPMAPTITVAPATKTATIGQITALTVEARGPYLSYQWWRDGTLIPGAQSASYSSPIMFAGEYSVVVSNIFGSVTSSPPAVVTQRPALPGAVIAIGAGQVDLDDGFYEGQSIVPPEAYRGVIAVAAGGLYSLALTTGGDVLAWGGDTFGPSPFPTPTRNDFAAIAAGWEHSLGLTRDGTVVAWGGNDYGQSSVPASLNGQAVAIAANGYHSLALKRDGSVEAWGANNQGQRTVPDEAHSEVVAIAAGGSHSMALKADGSVIAWGANWSGQLNVPESARHGVRAIAAGDSHCLALKDDGSVVAWGLNSTEGVVTGQTNVPPVAQSGVIAIAAGGNHSLALKSDGTVVAWGLNAYGQNDIPDVVQGSVTGISAGSNHTLLILGTAALQSRLTSDRLELSWPANLVGFHLETADSLQEDAAWQTVGDAPSVVGDQRTVLRPITGTPKWYRLSR